MEPSFETLGLSAPVLNALKPLGYTSPTPVQAQAIPHILKGKDVLAAAKTGTGKTAAFLLPSLDRLRNTKSSRPRMLVVTPTRELADQIAETCKIICTKTHHRSLSVVGGLAYGPQIKAIRQGIDVLIATPGRLIDLIEREVVDLGKIEILVLDEADRMLDMGFLPTVKKIVSKLPRKRQTLLFSATIDQSTLKQVKGFLSDPVQIAIAQRGETADTVEQYIINTKHSHKPELLQALLKTKGCFRVIVFTRTKSRADTCCRRLRRAGWKAEAIHSDRSQAQRKRALESFASGKTGILVATDVLARGIDISEVEYVVNFDLPDQPEDYVHRIGRTGRAGHQGFAVSFVTPESKNLLKDIQKLTKHDIPEMPSEVYAEALEEVRAHQSNEYKPGHQYKHKAHKADASHRRAQKSKTTPEHSKKRTSDAAKTLRHSSHSKHENKQQRKQHLHQGSHRGETPKKSRGRSQAAVRIASKNDLRPGRAQRAARAASRKHSR